MNPHTPSVPLEVKMKLVMGRVNDANEEAVGTLRVSCIKKVTLRKCDVILE